MNRTNIAGKASTGVVIGRLSLLLAAAGALVVGLAVARGPDRVSGEAAGRYVCPMHPQVVSAAPGDCPICNMALERVQDAKDTASIAAAHKAVVEVKRQLVDQVVRAPAWVGRGGVVTAVVHKESLEGFKPGDEAIYFPNAEPALAISVRLTSDPAAPWDSATVQIRLAARNRTPASPGRPGDTGWLQIGARPRDLLVVPESSILHAGDGSYVLAAPAGGHAFTRRSIEVGQILDSGTVADRAAARLGGVVVLSGLHEGERVVAGDTFVLDAERRLRAAQGHPEEIVE